MAWGWLILYILCVIFGRNFLCVIFFHDVKFQHLNVFLPATLSEIYSLVQLNQLITLGNLGYGKFIFHHFLWQWPTRERTVIYKWKYLQNKKRYEIKLKPFQGLCWVWETEKLYHFHGNLEQFGHSLKSLKILQKWSQESSKVRKNISNHTYRNFWCNILKSTTSKQIPKCIF